MLRKFNFRNYVILNILGYELYYNNESKTGCLYLFLFLVNNFFK